MKFRKLLAGISAASLAVSAMTAVSASAANTSIDFEDGNCSFVYMNLDSGSSDAVLSVEDYNGSKQLKVDVADKTAVPKVWFDLYKMMDKENVVKIKSIEFDLAIVPKTADGIVGWAGGAVGTAGSYGTQVKPGWSDKAWDGGAYEPGEVATVKVERKFLLPTEQYTEESESPFFGLMRWAAAEDADDYVMYIDNIVFKDESGNALPVNAGGAAPAPAAAEATTTTAPATGNVPEAVMLSVMAVAGVAAVATKKRK